MPLLKFSFNKVLSKMDSLREDIDKLATESTIILTSIWSEMGMSKSTVRAVIIFVQYSTSDTLKSLKQ